jgi:hypothetical protein
MMSYDDTFGIGIAALAPHDDLDAAIAPLTLWLRSAVIADA